ncbi:MAG: efflux RND transporter permease subunit [Vicinamibacteria bacterium]
MTEASGLFGVLQRQRALILTLTLAALLAGVLALSRLGSGIYPEVDFPRIVVVARAGDTPPELMEASVVRPLEESLATVFGVRRVRTRIIRGSAEIALQFEEGADMWRALQFTDAAIAQARGDLPANIEIESQKVTPADFPILSYNLVGGTSLGRREAADFLVRPALSRAAGVGRVDVIGGDPRELEVILDPQKLAAAHLRPSEAAQRVGEALVRKAVGRFDDHRQIVAVIAENEVTSAGQLSSLPMTLAANGPLSLGSLAEVVEGHPDRTRAVHGPEGDAVQVSISRLPEASAPDVVRDVTRISKDLRLPEGIRMVETYNQGQLIQDSVIGVRDAILIGIALTVLVLAVFLRNIRAGLLAAASVPFTLLATFPVMAIAGQTLNLMSLGGMAVAIGLVIDDAIVVIEAIALRIEEGLSPRDAVAAGLSEIMAPVIGTTLTTVVVFVPLAFISGLIGKFFAALAITLAGAVLLSLAFALFVLPVLAAAFMKARVVRKKHRRNTFGARYARLLSRSVRRPWLALVLVMVAVGAGVLAFEGLATGFMPEMDEGAFVIDYFLPAGSSLQATETAALQIEDALRETKDVQSWTRRTGAELGPVTATEMSRGDIAVLLKPQSERRPVEEVIDEVRRRVESQIPAARIEFVQLLEDVLNDLSGSARPVEVRILGPDHAALVPIAEEVEKRLEDTPHMVDYYRGFEDDAPTLRYSLNADTAARAGLTPTNVADDLKTALQGDVVGEGPRFDRLVPVRVRFPDAWRFDASRLADLPIALGPSVVPISHLATPSRTLKPSILLRENLVPVALATADIEGSDIGGLATEVSHRLAGLALPPGYRIDLGGQAESQKAAFTQLLSVLGLGVLAVFALLVGQFQSARAAVLVLLTVPPALAGGLIFLRLSDVPLNVSSLMGLVLLVGLVVKNGILLVENAVMRIEEGQPVHVAIRHAGRRRLRPIVMTTLCTIFGLLPLAFGVGSGSELQRPLAVAVIGGLLLSTAATLLLLPALGSWFLVRRPTSA